MRKFSTFNSTEYEFLRHCEEQRTCRRSSEVAIPWERVVFPFFKKLKMKSSKLKVKIKNSG